jgi:hypothetical protein
MGHVEFILEVKLQPERNMSLVNRSKRVNANINVPEFQRLIALWGDQINYLNSEIIRYRNQLASRKYPHERRAINRSIIKEYEKQVVEFTTKRDAAMVKLHLNRKEE